MKIDLLTPKFNFELILSNNEKHICRAEAYEINSDGSITFYQHAVINNDKKVKLAVLTYSKWSHCTLLFNGDYPVFNDVNDLDEVEEPEPVVKIKRNNSPFEETKSNNENNDMSFFNDFESEQQNESSHEESEEIQKEKLKAAKTEFLQEQIKEFVKIKNFDLNSFKKIISKYPIYQRLNISEFDIIWESSKLILDKSVLARRFNNPELQKELGLLLPNIMKRQWNGEMSPIIEVLVDLEPTKNATFVDLAVWMINNNWSYK